MRYETNSEQETKRIGMQIGKRAKPGDIFCLSGDLGVGKTVFTKGFAQGIGVTDYITSPTFTIINEYQGSMPFYHFDVYRISSLDEMDDTGYEEYFTGDGVCLVEWAELIKELIPPTAYWIEMEKDYSKGDDYRRITLKTTEKKQG